MHQKMNNQHFNFFLKKNSQNISDAKITWYITIIKGSFTNLLKSYKVTVCSSSLNITLQCSRLRGLAILCTSKMTHVSIVVLVVTVTIGLSKTSLNIVSGELLGFPVVPDMCITIKVYIILYIFWFLFPFPQIELTNHV